MCLYSLQYIKHILYYIHITKLLYNPSGYLFQKIKAIRLVTKIQNQIRLLNWFQLASIQHELNSWISFNSLLCEVIIRKGVSGLLIFYVNPVNPGLRSPVRKRHLPDIYLFGSLTQKFLMYHKNGCHVKNHFTNNWV